MDEVFSKFFSGDSKFDPGTSVAGDIFQIFQVVHEFLNRVWNILGTSDGGIVEGILIIVIPNQPSHVWIDFLHCLKHASHLFDEVWEWISCHVLIKHHD